MKQIILLLWIIFAAEILSAQNIINKNIYLRSNYGSQIMWDGDTVNIYGITKALSASPAIPAPTIICEEGDSVVLNVLSISQKHHHTIHLHGLDVNTRNDGDPATSFELHHMQDTTYSFKAKHAGTYLYHCHVGDVVHVQMGMYGVIIVKAAAGVQAAWTGGPIFNREKSWLMSEIDHHWHDSVPEHDTSGKYIQLPPYLPDYFLINGKSETQLDTATDIMINGAQNEKIYLRLSNIGFYDNEIVFPAALNAEITDSDGRPLPVSVITDTIKVSPGERYGVMLQPSSQFVDSIKVCYVNMNTGNCENSQYVTVNINGVSGNPENEKDSFKFFPNPAGDCLFFPSLNNCKVEIKDNFGRSIDTQMVNDNRISIKELKTGVYHLVIPSLGITTTFIRHDL